MTMEYMDITISEWNRLWSDILDEMHFRRSEGTLDKEDMVYLAYHLGEWNIAVRSRPKMPKHIYTYFKSVACGGPVFPSPWHEECATITEGYRWRSNS